MCPYCQSDVPVVYRGMIAYCTACGAVRPLASPTTSLNLAGQPSQVGGVLARVFGWIVLFVGLSIAGIVGALFQAIWPEGIVGWALGVPMMLVSLAAGIGLLKGGKSLSNSGKHTEEAAREKALYGLAQVRGGILTKDDVARALSVSVQEGDNYLTRLAKAKPDELAVDVDEEGQVLFRFRSIAARPRVGVRVDVARPPAAEAEPPRVVSHLDEELLAQAEEEAAHPHAPRQARRGR